eukprot:jgi/Picsp_1/4538/NSC_06759-R1_---NA---
MINATSHDWCTCNRCRRSSPSGDGSYQFRDTYLTNKNRHSLLRKRNRSNYPELYKLEEGDQQVKLLKSCVKGKRAPGYTFQEAMDFPNGKENIALNQVTESVAEIQGDRSEDALGLPDMIEDCDRASREHDEDQMILNQILPDEEESDDDEDESEDEEQDANESENEPNQEVQDQEDQWNVDDQFSTMIKVKRYNLYGKNIKVRANSQNSFGQKMIESKGNKKCNNFVIHTLSGRPRVASVLSIISCEAIIILSYRFLGYPAPGDQDPENFFCVKTFQRHEHCEHFGIGNKVYMEPYSTFVSSYIKNSARMEDIN